MKFCDSVAHLLKVAYIKDSKWFYPFANDFRWCHWAQNTVERHRFVEQKSVYVTKTPEFSTMSEQKLLEMVNANGEDCRRLLSSMRAYSGNILGSNAYFLQRRMELEALMVQEGVPSIWFTFSAADNHWHDLFSFLCDGDIPSFVSNEAFTAWKRRVVREHPHVVNSYFHKRFSHLLKHFFTESTLDYSYYWFRVEFQDRGTAHVHGCFRLRNDPGLCLLGSKVAAGRYAAFKLRHANKLSEEDDFELFRISEDEMNVTDGDDHESSGLDIEEEDNIDLSSDEECNRYGFRC